MDHPDQVARHVAQTVLSDATTPESLAAGAWSSLGSIGYCATRDRWDDVALNAGWLLALA